MPGAAALYQRPLPRTLRHAVSFCPEAPALLAAASQCARRHIRQRLWSVGSLHRSDNASNRGANQMTKFYALIAACAVFAPMAFATLNQAAQIVA